MWLPSALHDTCMLPDEITSTKQKDDIHIISSTLDAHENKCLSKICKSPAVAHDGHHCKVRLKHGATHFLVCPLAGLYPEACLEPQQVKPKLLPHLAGAASGGVAAPLAQSDLAQAVLGEVAALPPEPHSAQATLQEGEVPQVVPDFPGL